MGEILNIDDDPIHHEMVEAYCRKRGGHRCVRAMNGQEALAQIAKQPDRFELLMCDLNMPDFDGVELLRELRAIHCTTPLLIVSGAKKPIVAAASELARIYGLNIVATITKPLSFAAMAQAFDAAIAQLRPDPTAAA